MSKRLYYITVLCLCSFCSISQNKSDYQWIYGKTYNEIPGSDGIKVDYNGDAREISYFTMNHEFKTGASSPSICDKDSGSLLFYSNGCAVFDSTHSIMENGHDINSGFLSDFYCFENSGWYPGSENMIILPDPGYEDGYFLIHISINDFDSLLNSLWYSYIDMSNGHGAVIEKNVPILQDYSFSWGFLEAINHENGIDWWVILLTDEKNKYLKLLIDENSIQVDSQSIGPYFNDSVSSAGQATFSPNGEKYMWYNPELDLVIFDFDRETGILSNPEQVSVMDSSIYDAGIAVSSNSKYTYISSYHDLWQVDLESENLQESLTHIDHWNGEYHTIWSSFERAILGPDCKIYISTGSGSEYMHVIHSPNEKGTLCDFRQNDIIFEIAKPNRAIPNFPHFRVDEEQVCDPSITNIKPISSSGGEITLYPNPFTDLLTIDLDNDEDWTIKVYDVQGSLRHSEQVHGSNLELDIGYLNPGVYFLQVSNLHEVRSAKIVKN